MYTKGQSITRPNRNTNIYQISKPLGENRQCQVSTACKPHRGVYTGTNTALSTWRMDCM